MKQLIALLMVLTLMLSACTNNANTTTTTTTGADTSAAASTTESTSAATEAQQPASPTPVELKADYFLLDTGKRTDQGDFIYELWQKGRESDKIEFWFPADHRVMVVPHVEEGLMTFARSEEQEMLATLQMKNEENGVSADRLLIRDKKLIRAAFDFLLAQYDTASEAFRFLTGTLTEADAEMVPADKAPAEGYTWKLDADRFADLEAFKAYLSSSFTADMVKAAMDKEIVREFEGALYVKKADAHPMFGTHHSLEIKQVGGEYHYILRTIGEGQFAQAGPFVLDQEAEGAYRFQNFDEADDALHHGTLTPIK